MKSRVLSLGTLSLIFIAASVTLTGRVQSGVRGQGARGRGNAPVPVTIHAARVLDGRGGMVVDGVVTVEGDHITSVRQRTSDITSFTYDLGDATLLPGMIDVHVHINWFFGENGKFGSLAPAAHPAGYFGIAIQENTQATLMSGFTTVQSLGSASDKQLRDAIAARFIVGPRLLSSLYQISPGNSTPEQLRESVRRDKANGSDVIKLFASGQLQTGGKMNVTKEQIEAVCGEAKAQGLRSLVHAIDSTSIITSVNAGCFEIEHGMFADDEAIATMKKANIYFDPNIGLVLQNYVEKKERFLGSPNFTVDDIEALGKVIPQGEMVFKKALAAGLRMPLGTDAVAGAHGQNAREIIARVAAGQKSMDAIISATWLAAESLNLGATIGTLAPNYTADMLRFLVIRPKT